MKPSPTDPSAPKAARTAVKDRIRHTLGYCARIPFEVGCSHTTTSTDFEGKLDTVVSELLEGLLEEMPEKQHKATSQPYNSREQKIAEYQDEAANMMLAACIEAITRFFGESSVPNPHKKG